jgi:hypothetical protein
MLSEQKREIRKERNERVWRQRMTGSLLAQFVVSLLHRVEDTRKEGENRPKDCLLFSKARSRSILVVWGGAQVTLQVGKGR